MSEQTSSTPAHSIRLPLRWRDFDRYQHVNNAAYVELAQEGRMIWGYQEFKDAGLDIPHAFVRHLEIDYARPLGGKEQFVTIDTWVTQVGITSFTTRQELKNDEGVVAATLTAVQVVVDLKTGAPRQLSPGELQVLAKAAAASKK